MTLNSQQDLHCDVCVVGAGPAGLTLADALIQQGRSVVVLESGRETPAPDTAALNIAPLTGDSLPPMDQARARAVGGTASIWSTVRGGKVGGKYLPLDPIDLAMRAATPWSGWPITRPELDPWYAAAHQAAGLAPFEQCTTPSPDRLLPFGPDSLSFSDYHWGAADRFTSLLPADLERSTRCTLLRGCTATTLTPTPNGHRVSSVAWAAADGAHGRVHAADVVLAAGAVENTRLLLVLFHNSRRATPYWLGRGFMEHPIDRSLTLVSRHPALSPNPGSYAFAGRGARAHLVGRIGLSGQLMHAEGLRNASLRLFPLRHRLLARQFRQLSHRLGRTPATTYRVLLDLEQAPHPDNRITLTDRCDALGMPMVQVHWQWRPEDEQFRRKLLHVIQREFARHGCGEAKVTEGIPLENGVHHHAGTTRMHTDPALGVVDSTLRLHDHDNLYVTGASVFPTCGVANPTLTVVALSLRLAAQLARR